MQDKARSGFENSSIMESFPIILLLLSLFSCTAFSDTVFVADRGNYYINGFGQVDVFHVDANPAISLVKSIEFSGDKYGYGPIDLAIDDVSQTIFVSFENMDSAGEPHGTCQIGLIDFNTLIHTKDFEFPLADDFGGLWYDSQRQSLYVVERSTNQVYILKWRPDNQTLEFERIVHLPNIQYACAIQVDGDMAYVTEFRYKSPMQRYDHIVQYDISRNWAHVQTIPNEAASTCLAYDADRQIFYSGTYDYTNGSEYRYIIKHSLSPDEIILKSDTGVMIDGDIDESNGYLYLTAYRGESSNLSGAIEIWNPSGWTSDPNQQIGPLVTYDNASVLAGPAGILHVNRNPKSVAIEVAKEDGLNPNNSYDWVYPGETITYTITIDPNDPNNITHTNMVVVDYLPLEVDYEDQLNPQPSPPPTAEPNIVFGITDANSLDQITLNIGQSIRLYVTKETTDADIYGFVLEATLSDPNLGWIDNTEYDPNDSNSGTAEILANPRDTAFDYYGPGFTQYEGIQFCGVSFGNSIQDGDLASFLYTAAEPGYVILSLVNYDAIPATLQEIVICQVDPNDPNNIPGDPNMQSAPPAATSAGFYDGDTHTVTWELGAISEPVILTLTVRVNNKAEPMGLLLNEVTAASDQGFGRGYEQTQVGCFGGDIIYVDASADAGGSGTNWDNAYQQLSDALKRAAKDCAVNEIWVADGMYNPGPQAADTFQIQPNDSLYGGFAGGEISIDQRNINANPTILSGYIRTDPYNGNVYRNETVVKMGNNTCLDGFIVKDSGSSDTPGYGIYGKNADFAILNCTIEDNQQYGLYAENSNLTIQWCTSQNNGWHGIYHIGSLTASKAINIANCRISGNERYGIYAENSVPSVRNNQIGFNGAGSSDIEFFYGLYLFYPKTGYDVRNNTVIYNVNEGIRVNKTDPNTPLDIYNCILYGNKGNSDEQLKGSVAARYSCIWDPNNIYTTPDANHNISCNPNFAYDNDPNIVIYHLLPDSPCIDKGHPSLDYADQNDLDAEPRWMGDYVDMGADEICPDCTDVYNSYDWNADGLVNFDEFNRFSRAWLSWNPYLLDPNCPDYGNYAIDPNDCLHWDNHCNLIATGTSQYIIDLEDLQIFLDESPWLWWACWRVDIRNMIEQQAQQSMMMSMNGSEGMLSQCSTAAPGCAATDTSLPVTMDDEAAALPAETIEVFDPVAERAVILSLLEDIEVFIDAGDEDAKTWRKIKNLLRQNLVEIEDMISDPNEI